MEQGIADAQQQAVDAPAESAEPTDTPSDPSESADESAEPASTRSEAVEPSADSAEPDSRGSELGRSPMISLQNPATSPRWALQSTLCGRSVAGSRLDRIPHS